MKKKFVKLVIGIIAMLFLTPPVTSDAGGGIKIEKKFDRLAAKSLKKRDKNHDGFLSGKELKKIVTLTIKTRKTVDLKNLKQLKNLKRLKIQAKALKHQDQIRKLGKLTKLKIISPKTKSLDLTKNRKLSSVTLKMPKATDVRLYGKNRIRYLNLEIAKGAVKCVETCQNLQSLELTGFDGTDFSTGNIKEVWLYGIKGDDICIHNTDALVDLYLDGVNTFSIDNREHLKNLSLWNCMISELTISGYPKLEKLKVVQFPNLTKLNLGELPKIKTLGGWDNKRLTELSLEGILSLELLTWHDGGLKHLTVASDNNIEEVYVINNRLCNLDFTKLKKLKQLEITNNHYEGMLDLTPAEKLVKVDCSRNNLYKIAAKNNKNLQTLICEQNHLKVLDLSGSVKLSTLECERNPFVEIYLYRESWDFCYDSNAVIHKLW